MNQKDVWLRLLFTLMAFALIAAACGEDSEESVDDGADNSTEVTDVEEDQDDDSDEEDGDDLDDGDSGEPLVLGQICMSEVENAESEPGFVDAICHAAQQLEGLSEELNGIEVVSCGPDQFPELRRIADEGVGELVYWSHGVIRFHPTDSLNDGGQAVFEPTSYFGAQQADGEVFVVDKGAHLDFVSSIIYEMTGIWPNALEPGGGLYFWSESDIVGVIGDLGADVFVNMSFGTYTCSKDGPETLRNTMSELADQGVKFFVSAGNDETAQLSWPAGFGMVGDPVLTDAVTSVGSVAADGWPEKAMRSCFSNFDGVEAWLPGEEVYADSSQWSGTSFAAPQALSLAVLGVLPDYLIADPTAPANQYGIEWTGVDGKRRSGSTYCSGNNGYQPILDGLTYL